MAACSLDNPGSEMGDYYQDAVCPTQECTPQEIPSTSLGLRASCHQNYPESMFCYPSTDKMLTGSVSASVDRSLSTESSNALQNCPISSLIEKMDQDTESDNGFHMKSNLPTDYEHGELLKNTTGKQKLRKNIKTLRQYLINDGREINMVTLNGWGALMGDIRKMKKKNRTLKRVSNVKKRRRKNTSVSENVEQQFDSNPVFSEQTTDYRVSGTETEKVHQTESDNEKWERLQWLLMQDDIVVDEVIANNWMSLMNGIRKRSPATQRNLKTFHSESVVEIDLEVDPDFPFQDLRNFDNGDLHDIDFHDFINLEWPDDELGILTGQAGAQVLEESYPKGEVVERECYICYELKKVTLRVCCGIPLCDSCMDMYLKTQVQDAIVKIECLNMECDSYVHRDEVFARLPIEMKSKYYKFLIDANKDPHMKTCPRCNHVRKIRKEELTVGKKIQKRGLQVTCDVCELVWCFACHAPWHEGVTCKQFRKGDKLVKHWAKEQHFGQRNAQKCPKCKVFIERIQGCDHMTCSKCSSEFCYRCGERYFTDLTRILGNHHSKFSPLGCKYNLLPDRPVARRCIRGAVASGKVLGTIVLAGLAVAAGAGLLSFGVIALPIYCCHKGFKKRKRNRARRRRELWATPRMNLDYIDIAELAEQVPEPVENGESSENSPSWSDFSSSSGGYSDSNSLRSLTESDSSSSIWMDGTDCDKNKTSVSVGNVDITVKSGSKSGVTTTVESQESNIESEYPEIILKVKSRYKDSPVVEQPEYLTNVKGEKLDQKTEQQNSGKSSMHVSSVGESPDGSGNECGYRLSFDKKFKVMLDNLHAKVKENHTQITRLQNKIATAAGKPTDVDYNIDDTENFRFIDEDFNQKMTNETGQNEYPSDTLCSTNVIDKSNSTPELLPHVKNDVVDNNVQISEMDDKCSPGCFVNILKSESSKHKYMESPTDLESQDVSHDTCAVQGCFVNLFSKRLSLPSKEGDKPHVKKELARHMGDVKISDNYIISSDQEDNRDIGIVCSEKIFSKADNQTENISGLLGNTATETYL